MSTTDVTSLLVGLREAYRMLADDASLLAADANPVAQLDRLLELADEVKARSLDVRAHVTRTLRWMTESQRRSELLGSSCPSPEDISLALLRGDWIAARDALRRTASEGRGDVAHIAAIAGPAVQCLLDGAATALTTFEHALRRISRAADTADLGRLQGALLLCLGRLYRDQLGSTHLARSAFEDGKKLLPDEPEPLVELAELARRGRRLGDAHDGFQAATELAPHRAGAWLGLAALDEDNGAWLDAATHFERAARLLADEPDPVAALDRVAPTQMGSAYYHLALATRHSQRETAIQALDRALQLKVRGPTSHPIAEVYRERGTIVDPVDASSMCEAGKRFLWRAEYETAERCLNRALEVEPDHSEAALLLADVCRMRAFEHGADRVECLRKALLCFERGLGDQPVRLPWALASRAYCHEGLGTQGTPDSLWEAVIDAEHGMIIDRASSFALTCCARMHSAVGNEVTARTMLGLAFEQAPSDGAVAEHYLRVLANASEFDRALEVLPHAPDTPWRRGVEGLIRIRQRRSAAELERARSDLASAAESFAWAGIGLGLCNLLLGNTTDATTCFAHAVTLAYNPLERAEVLLWVGEYEEVDRITRPALAQATGDYVDHAMLLAVSLLARQRVEEARALFTEAVQRVSGPNATNWRVYVAQDLTFMPALNSPEALELREAVARELEIRSSAATHAITPREEIERAVRDAVGRRRTALLLARARLALEANDADEAFACYSQLPAERAAIEGRIRTAAIRATHAASRDDRQTVQQMVDLVTGRPELIVAQLTDSAQAAVVVNHMVQGDRGPVLEWLQNRLGLAPRPRAASSQLTLTIPQTALDAAKRLLPEVRRTIEARYGVTLPAVDVRWDPDAVACELWLGRAQLGRWEQPVQDDETKPDGPMLEKAARAILCDGGSELSSVALLGGWLVNTLAGQLMYLIGLEEVVGLVDTWEGMRNTGEPLMRRSHHLLRLFRLVRGLLGEQIALAPWQTVTDAARRWRKRSADSLLAHTRLQLRHAINTAIERVGGTPVTVPKSLETAIAAMVQSDSSGGYLAAPPADIAAIIAELHALADGVRSPVLVVSDVDTRVWLRRITALEMPLALVVARTEVPRPALRESAT